MKGDGNPKSALMFTGAFVSAMLAPVAAFGIEDELIAAVLFSALFCGSLILVVWGLVVRITGKKEYEHAEPKSTVGKILLNGTRIILGSILLLSGVGSFGLFVLHLISGRITLGLLMFGLFVSSFGLYGLRAGLRRKIEQGGPSNSGGCAPGV